MDNRTTVDIINGSTQYSYHGDSRIEDIKYRNRIIILRETTMNKFLIFELLQASLWNKQIDKDIFSDFSWEDFNELRIHGLTMLPVSILPSLPLDPEIRKTWEKSILSQLSYYCRYVFLQNNLSISVPYVILKGTSAAKYYPFPEYRAFGDIDIIPCREGAKTVCDELLADGFKEVSLQAELERGRHRSFSKNGVQIEVHVFFASLNDPKKAEKFDNMIMEHIDSTHILPDSINGMVLIEHINQHMEEGIGLRQIIDFMMFVDVYLTDDRWPTFHQLLLQFGLETLAITVTRMCELYLGLVPHKWSMCADEKLCASLMEYILSSGEFGKSLNNEEHNFINRLLSIKNPFVLILQLQKLGSQRWEGAKHPLLKPFSWIWQGIHFFKESRGMLKESRKAIKLHKLFSALGVKRRSEGLIYYENGKYIIK